MDLPPAWTEPKLTLRAHAQTLVLCIEEGFQHIPAHTGQKVAVVYGDYASLAVLRSLMATPVRGSSLWGAKVVESPDAPDHTFVLAAPRRGRLPDDLLVVRIEMIFQ